MFTQSQIDEIVTLLSEVNDDTKIYFGCDSVRYRQNGREFAKFATVCIVHMNGSNGCRIFSNQSVEPDYDAKKNRPRTRMMNEVMKVCELYIQLIPYIEQFAELVEGPDGEVRLREFEVEIHLDINEDPMHGSNCAAKEAAGYVLGMTGVEPKLKPESFAASFGADACAHGRAIRATTDE